MKCVETTSASGRRSKSPRAPMRWRRVLWVGAGLVVLVGGVVAVGPRPSLERRLEPSRDPSDHTLDHTLDHRLDSGRGHRQDLRSLSSQAMEPRSEESPKGTSVPSDANLKEEVEATVAAWDREVEGDFRDPRCRSRVRWAGMPGEKTDLSIVYVHGFSASPQDLYPTMDLVAESLRANVVSIRLTGHCQVSDSLSEAKARQWLEDVEKARAVGRRIGQRTLLVGMSTGATLAALSAVADREDLAGLALLSPNFGVRNRTAEILTWPWGRELAALVTGSRRHKWQPESELRATLWTSDYDVNVVAEMQLLVHEARRADLSRIQVPTLVVHAAVDDVVSLEQMKKAYDALGASTKRFEVLPGSTRHELAGFAVAPELSTPLADLVAGFFLSPSPAAAAPGHPVRER